jgi:hypothetical protein
MITQKNGVSHAYSKTSPGTTSGLAHLASQIKQCQRGEMSPVMALQKRQRNAFCHRLSLVPKTPIVGTLNFTQIPRKDNTPEDLSRCKRVRVSPHSSCHFTQCVHIDGRKVFLVEDDGEWLSPTRFTLRRLDGHAITMGGSMPQCLERAKSRGIWE